jgi:hypothetical protein
MLSGASLREKVEWVTSSMKTLVDQATLTAQDLDKLKKQVLIHTQRHIGRRVSCLIGVVCCVVLCV